jgi:hypothetical protein
MIQLNDFDAKVRGTPSISKNVVMIIKIPAAKWCII